MSTTIPFSSVLWRYQGEKGSWYFITLPRKDADFIKWVEEKTIVGLGFVRVEVTIGKSTWQTSIFPTREGEYLLAIKSDIRKKEHIYEGALVKGNFILI